MSAINVNVSVQNQFSQSAKIQLWHQFASNTPQQFTWSNIGPGAVTSSVVVTGSTSAGHDYWQMRVSLGGGQGGWSHTSNKTCTIESADQGTYQTQVVKPTYWYIALTSGSCSTSLSPGVSGAAAVFVGSPDPDPENKKSPGASQSQ